MEKEAMRLLENLALVNYRNSSELSFRRNPFERSALSPASKKIPTE